MSTMCLSVSFLAGTTIQSAVSQAHDLAVSLNLAYVEFTFNGINVNVSRYANTVMISDEFSDVMARGETNWVI